MFLSQAYIFAEGRKVVGLSDAFPFLMQLPGAQNERTGETDRNGDHAVQPVPSPDRLDRIGDQVPRLERVTHAERAHRDPVRDGGRPEPVPGDAGIGERFLDPSAESQDVLVAAVWVGGW